MTDKVKELVEWVAERIHAQNYSNGGALHDWDKCKQSYYKSVAKKILSHPDLALIDVRFLWAIKAVLKGIQINQHNDPAIAWKTEIDTFLEEFDNKIIPLAEALKEVK